LGLLAHVLISKYCDRLPLYRQSKIYAHDGLDLPRRLGRLRDCHLPPRAWEALLGSMLAAEDAAGRLVARAAARQLGKADHEAVGVLSSAQCHTHLLDSPRLAAGMACSDFRLHDLRTGSAMVFLVLPPDRMGYATGSG
jgi:type IV secretory pathway TraG/TraD family ATPase VirD4